MQWQFIVALVIAIPIVLIPVAFIWYLNIAGLYSHTKEARERRAAVRRLLGEAIQIIRGKQALDRSILEAIEAADKKQTDSGGGPGRREGEEAIVPERALSGPAVETLEKVESRVAVVEKVAEEEKPAQIEEVIDEATGKICLPPCQIACPVGEPIQRTNAMIAHLPLDAEGASEQVIKIADEIYEKNPLFTVCSYICGLCERECNYNDVGGAIRRRMLKRFLTDYYLPYLETKPPLPYPTREKVAVIGGGPGGLMCAYMMSKKGYQVTILERGVQLGGALRYIPQYRLPRNIIDATLDNLVRIAHVDVRFGIEMGKGGNRLDDLVNEGYQAVFIATGTHSPRPLTFDGQLVAGADLDGVAFGLPFLLDVNQGRVLPQLFRQLVTHKKVIVVGGGDTALEEALELAKFAKEVKVVHRRSQLRASRILQKRAFNNPKIGFIWNAVVQEIIGAEKVEGVRLKRRNTGEEFTLECDAVFVAIGSKPNTEIFKNQIELDEDGYIVTHDETKTSVEGVFAAGDVQDRRYRQAIVAAASGCKAALDAEKYLEKENS